MQRYDDSANRQNIRDTFFGKPRTLHSYTLYIIRARRKERKTAATRTKGDCRKCYRKRIFTRVISPRLDFVEVFPARHTSSLAWLCSHLTKTFLPFLMLMPFRILLRCCPARLNVPFFQLPFTFSSLSLVKEVSGMWLIPVGVSIWN